MELTQLKYFQTVARLGSVSKAAKELYVSQPSLSRSISRLEQELGMPLFEHRKGKITLNDCGRMFLGSVDIVLSELSTGIQRVKRMYDSEQNSLALGGSVSEVLPDMLIGFSIQYPNIGIRQFDCSPNELQEKLLSGDLDFGVTTSSLEDEALITEVMDEKAYVILTSGEHPLADKKSITLNQLNRERFICSESRLGKAFLQQICRSAGFEPDIAFEVESNELIYRLLESDQGVAMMPASHISKIYRDYPENNIRLIQLEDDIPPSRLSLVYRRDYRFSQAAQLFLEFMQEWLQKEGTQAQTLIRQEQSGD